MKLTAYPKIFVFTVALCCGLLGFALWLLISPFALKALVWKIAFPGYGALFGFLGAVLYHYHFC